MQTISISATEAAKVLSNHEGQFIDMKSKRVQPAKLTKSLSAFANADGGTLYIGIEEDDGVFSWAGFADEEDANGFIQAFEQFFPTSTDFRYEFLSCPSESGVVLVASVLKTQGIRKATDGKPYVRRGAQNLPVDTAEAYTILERAKGVSSFEDSTVDLPLADVTNSTVTLEFMLQVVPHAEPDEWLRKQRLIGDANLPAVAAVVLFAEEPQTGVPKAAIKIYRYKTAEVEGTRETLAFDPITIEGHIYSQITTAVQRTVDLTEQIQILGDGGLESIRYPHESLHEIITNAVLHRDYGLNDDVHIRIFDNRIEVESPGRLPAHITPSNILAERFARNPKIVRLINKFPNPPNKDVGEGLNTAFRAMHNLRLREPQIIERPNSVLVNIRHERLASPEQQIVAHIREHGSINNAEARNCTGVPSEVQVRKFFRKLIDAGEIEKVPGTTKSNTRYQIPSDRR